MNEATQEVVSTPSFTKGQSVVVKQRGVSSDLTSYKGQVGYITRGGKNVTVTFDSGFDTTTVRVPATSLATSIRK